MRRFSLALAFLLVIKLAPGQALPSGTPNAIRLTKYALCVSDLDRTYAFYHALGLDLDNGAAIKKPSPLPDGLLKLVDAQPGARFRNMMLKIPNAPFEIEVTEFSNMPLQPIRPRIQDPGASLLIFSVDNLEAASATAMKAGGEAVEGAANGGGKARAVTLRDPDGFYVELTQAGGVPSGSGKVVGATFGSIVVKDSEKAAAFYRDRLGFAVKSDGWTSKSNSDLGVKGAESRSAELTLPGAAFSWRLLEFKGVDRKSYTPRISDPGGPAIGLQVRDIGAAVAAVIAAGGTSITQGGSVQMGSGKVGFVRDPSGILIELAQPKP